MGLSRQRHPTRRAVLALLLAVTLSFSAGCFREGPQSVVRLQANADDSLNIGVDDEGWYVSVGSSKAVHVTEQIIVEAVGSSQLIIWHNDDDRYHEIMFHRDHSDRDAIHINPGERVERWVELDFEQHIHSHNAPEMPELHVRVEQTAGR